jgi:Ca-activated chloride channel family protein
MPETTMDHSMSRGCIHIIGAVVAAIAVMAEPGRDARAQNLEQPPAPAPTFRSGVSLVALTVTVERANGSYVSHLESRDFRVFEEGVEQEVAFFGADEVPVDLVLMLDTSASMYGRLSVAQRAASNFIQAVRPTDRAVLMTFGARAEIVVPFTADRRRLTQAIEQLRAGGTTALYNAVYVALQEFGRTKPADADAVRRRAIVVLSDGDDTTSVVSYDSVIEQARRVGVGIYVIALQPPGDGSERSPGGPRYEMQQLARETGGRAFFPDALGDLEGVYGAIAGELDYQYAIGYVPVAPPTRNQFRRVAIVVDEPGVRVRTRSGYISGG